MLRDTYHNILIGVLLLIQRLKVLDWSLIIRELVCTVLGVFSELEVDVLRDRALARLQCARDEVQQSGFAGTVCAEDGYAGVHAE